MARTALEGSRIRERRALLGLRQSDVARAAAISPAYLNLIEHNRRRAGAEVLERIAAALSVEVAALTEGGEAALIEGLRAAAAAGEGAEVERTEEFAGRFPGWAALAADQARRIERLERTVAVLSDRMAHDPFLSAALHETLSVATSIRSTAAILAEGGVDPEWQARFHATLDREAQRLSGAAGTLASYLDVADPAGEAARAASPQEEFEQWFAARGSAVPELESPEAGTIDRMLAGLSPAAAGLARRRLARVEAEARAMPLGPFAAAWAERPDPLHMAALFAVPPEAAMRRAAILPDSPAGLVICDASGTLTFRKAVAGFGMPRFGAACPLWPLFRALSHPGQPLRMAVETAGRRPERFTVWALARLAWPEGIDGAEVAEATMLILPDPAPGPQAPLGVGTTCRICPKAPCAARREPSILAEGA